MEPEMGRKVSEIERAHYLKDPYKFTRTLLVEGRSGRLTRPKEIVEGLLKETHSDTLRGLTPVNQNRENS